MSAREENQPDLAAAAEQFAALGPFDLTPAGVCAEAEVDRGLADRLWRAMGFPDIPEDTAAFSSEDARALRLAADGLDELPPEQRERVIEILVAQARMVSGHLAAIAEIQLEATGAAFRAGLRSRLPAEALAEGLDHSSLGWLFLYLLRRQLHGAAPRQAGDGETSAQEMAVGFVDLVGFSEATRRLDHARLGALLSSFESVVADVLAESGGRLVKLIGDEAMFAHADSVEAVAAAQSILDECGRDGLPEAHAGIAAGGVLIHGGDLFGATVNLASRLAAHAPPRGLLIDSAAAKAIDRGGERVELERVRGYGRVKAVLLRQ